MTKTFKKSFQASLKTEIGQRTHSEARRLEIR